MHLMLLYLIACEVVIHVVLVKAESIFKLLKRLNGTQILSLSIPFESLEVEAMIILLCFISYLILLYMVTPHIIKFTGGHVKNLSNNLQNK